MASDMKKKKKNTSCECRLRPHMPMFQVLVSPETSGKLRNEALKNCSGDCIHKICEVVYNLLKGNIPLSPSQKRELSTKKHILRKLVKPQSNKKRRQLLLKQKGGSLLNLVLRKLLQIVPK